MRAMIIWSLIIPVSGLCSFTYISRVSAKTLNVRGLRFLSFWSKNDEKFRYFEWKMGLYVPFNDIGVIYFPLADATQFLWKNSADQFLGTTPEVPALTPQKAKRWQKHGELLVIGLFYIFYDGLRSILWGAEVRLRPAVIILWRRVEVTVMVMVVVVVLRGGVVVVMVVVVTLDVSVGKEERGRGRWWLLGGCDALCQSPVALDGAIPTRRTQLRSGGEETERELRRGVEEGWRGQGK